MPITDNIVNTFIKSFGINSYENNLNLKFGMAKKIWAGKRDLPNPNI